MGFVVDDFTYIMRDHSARPYVSFPEEIVYPQNFSPNLLFFYPVGKSYMIYQKITHFTTPFVLYDAKKN
jgi:hypothetical protein